ncbi:MAG: 16S rRNA (uracil(1498)-N(3))-methyltransferase [Rhodospirillaceae bacterium]|nr:16S rRNA (uracil(1498)-N(3))-methyltransferase [Rhodospirillaceae bacterium]
MSSRPAATAPRLFVPDPLLEGAEIALSAAQAHYLRSVMRLTPGATVRLFNGCDGAWLGTIDHLAKGAAMVRASVQIQTQHPEPDIWLLFAPIKSARQDVLVEKAVELGASVLLPVLTARTQIRRINTDRLRAQAVEAAEQCERLSVPDIRPLTDLATVLRTWPTPRHLWHADESGNGEPALAAFSAVKSGPGDALLIGPEGGFSSDELDLLASASFSKGVGLGPRILRAETAAIVALSLWQAAAGDGTLPPGY